MFLMRRTARTHTHRATSRGRRIARWRDTAWANCRSVARPCHVQHTASLGGETLAWTLSLSGETWQEDGSSLGGETCANATMQAAIVRAELCVLCFFLQCAGMLVPQCFCLSRSVPVQRWRFAQWRDCLTPAVSARLRSTSPPVASTPAGRVADRAQCATSHMPSGKRQGRAN